MDVLYWLLHLLSERKSSGIIHFIRRSISPISSRPSSQPKPIPCPWSDIAKKEEETLPSYQTPYAIVIRHVLATSNITRDYYALGYGPVHAHPYGPSLQIHDRSQTCPRRLSAQHTPPAH